MKEQVLNAFAAQKMIGKAIEVPSSQLVKNYTEITLKAPLVLKIVSGTLVHKTEVGGVKIVMHPAELLDAYNELINTAKKHKLKLDGILVQEYIEGIQLIAGIKKDITFGPIIALGLGGIYTELLKDIAIRKCPITLPEAKDMIESLRSKELFHGFRDIKLNEMLLLESIVALSQMAEKNERIKELDINPLMLNEKRCVAVDVRIVLEK